MRGIGVIVLAAIAAGGPAGAQTPATPAEA